ncbi:MAG TPA: hypothetical protein VGI74_18020 [Streptosporangiaceae bacterium]
MSGGEPWPGKGRVGVDWFAASLDQILVLARASDLDADLADDLIEARDLALMMGDWAKHRAACGDYFFTISLSARSEDQVSRRTFTVPHDPEAAEFIAKLTLQLGALAGQRAQDHEVRRALTELTALGVGLIKALTDSLSKLGGETS